MALRTQTSSAASCSAGARSSVCAAGRVVARPAARRVVQCASAAATAHQATAQKSYYVVQNVFKVKPESYSVFEEVWRTRESHLKEMPGFVRFAMLKCDNIPGKYVSQTHWASKADFENWANSSQFKASHGQGSSSGSSGAAASKRPNTMSMLEGPPSPEMYSSVTVTE